MAGIIISALAALLVFFGGINPSEPWMNGLFILGGLFLYFIYFYMQTSSLGPLQKVEQNQTAFASDILEKDHWFSFANVFLTFFAIFSIYLPFDVFFKSFFEPKIIFAFWLFLFGIATAILNHLENRLKNYLSPVFLTDRFFAAGMKAISDDNVKDLLKSIDALSEIACNSLDRSQPSLSIQAVESVRKITKEYLNAAKTISHQALQKATKPGEDPVIFMLFNIFQRFEMINEHALKHRFEPVISSIITSLGEMTIDAAKYDISLAIYPILETGKISTKAEKEGFTEVSERATFSLLESGKRILKEIDTSHLELKETFFALISQLEKIEKSAFKRDKTVSTDLLIHPFAILLSYFKDEKTASHQDTPAIITDINRVIDEFKQLELIMRTIPPFESLAGDDIQPASPTGV